MNKNSFKYVLSEIFYVCTGLLTAGTVLQAFFLEMGIDEQTISFIEAILMVIQSASMFFFSGYIEKKQDIKGVYTKSMLVANIMLLPMLFFCFSIGYPVTLAFALICIFAILSRIGSGIQIISLYKLPYLILDMKNYGSLLATSSIIGGVSAMLFSSAIMSINKSIGFFTGMRYILIFGIILVLATIFIISSTKVINNYAAPDKKEAVTSILKYKPFYLLLIPNLCRGIFSGVISVAALIGSFNKAINSGGALALAIILQLGAALGALLYSALCRKNIDGKIILVFSVLSSVFLFFIVTSNTYVFYASFFAAKIASTVIDNAIPVAVTKIVDYSHIGRYSAYRMLLHTVGTAIGSAVIIHVINIFGRIPAMICGGVCILICGISYYLYFFKNYKKNKK